MRRAAAVKVYDLLLSRRQTRQFKKIFFTFAKNSQAGVNFANILRAAFAPKTYESKFKIAACEKKFSRRSYALNVDEIEPKTF